MKNPKKRKLGRGVAVVGAGMSKFGMFRDRDSKDLFAEAYVEMVASVDKGLDPEDMEWVEMEGRGDLCAFTWIAIGPPFMIEEGYNRKNPYCSGVVGLKEGVRIDARIEGVNTLKPESIQVGLPLKVKFLHRQKEGIEKTYLSFEPV